MLAIGVAGRNRSVVLGAILISACLALAGCRSTLPSFAPPGQPLPQSGSPDSGTVAAIVHVRVPLSQSKITSVRVADSLYDVAPIGKVQQFAPSSCQKVREEHVCTATFSAPVAVNEIQVDAYAGDSKTASGTFPVDVTSKGGTVSAVIGAKIASLSIEPFLGDSLPVSQSEGAWIVALDSQHSAIIGAYDPAVTLSATGYLTVAPGTLQSSADEESLRLAWKPGFHGGTDSTLKAVSGTKSVSLVIEPGSGVVTFRTTPDVQSFSPGAIAVAPGTNGYVYFALNDNDGCAGSICKTQLWRFDPVHEKFAHVAFQAAAGIKEMYFASDGSLLMSTFQTVGPQYGDLPVVLLRPGTFSAQYLEVLPSGVDQASGFVEDASENLWISRCQGHACQGSEANPNVVLTPTDGSEGYVIGGASLPASCANFGSGQLFVGDIGREGGSFYVVGRSNSPSSAAALWRVTQTSSGSISASCAGVPASFDPSLYFAPVDGKLVFGVGGSTSAAHGFYKLANGAVSVDVKPRGTAERVSAHDGVVYYVADGGDSAFKGLGAYRPGSGDWNVFPVVPFSGAQPSAGDGIAAVDGGAWFTYAGSCGKGNGVCLGRAVFLSPFAVIPQMNLGTISKGQKKGFGVFADPRSSKAEAEPFNVHSGPFIVQSHNPSVCKVAAVAPWSFTVEGLRAGPCPITVSNKTQTVNVVTNVR